MKIFLHLFLGYSVFCVSHEGYKILLNLSNKARIKLLNVRYKNEKLYVRVYAKDEKRLIYLLDSACVEYRITVRRGCPEIFKKYRHRVGLISGIIAFFLVMYISPLFIWEINISGLERIKREDAEKLLNESGVSIGAFSPLIERSRLYSEILLKSKDISWISVNIIGSSANVEILERDYEAAVITKADGANIIALKDGYIIDTDIKKGRRIVSDGTVVKKDEMLVSGVYDTAKMGTRYVYSDAKVFAGVNDAFSVEIPLKTVKKEYCEEIIMEKTVKIFGKSINILKNYTKSIEKYDTIIREESIPYFAFDRLPVALKSVCALPYETVEVALTEEEALDRARIEIQRMVSEADYTEVLEYSENYYIKNDILYLNCSVEAIQNIALVSEFDVN